MLVSFLKSHPNIHAEREILAHLDGRDYKKVLKQAFHRDSYKIKAMGFKIFYYHPLDDSSGEVWKSLQGMNNLFVIHLKRRNILRTLISRKIAGSQDNWISTSSEKHNSSKDKSVSFTAKELEESFRETRQWETAGDKMFENHPLLKVYYEDLVNDPENSFSQITNFLDLQYAKPKTNLNKQNPENIRDLVINYEELKSQFKNTDWQPFFEE